MDQIVAEQSCYPRDQLVALWAGRSILSLIEILDLAIPAQDRLWACWRPGALSGAQYAAIIDRIVSRAVRIDALTAATWTEALQTATSIEPQMSRERAASVAAEAVRAAATGATAGAARAARAAEYSRQIDDVRAVLRGTG